MESNINTLPDQLRASYSILGAWARGEYQRAIDMYLGVEVEATPQMLAGREFHKQWENEIRQTNCLPKVFGSMKLKNPQPELKIYKDLTPWLGLVGVIDLYDDGVIYDWKTGRTVQNADDWQCKVYQILLPDAKRAEIHHYDQYSNEVSVSICHLTEETLMDAVEWVITMGGEMYHYLQKNDIRKTK